MASERLTKAEAGWSTWFRDVGDFRASDAAERFLRERGYSVGPMQCGAPRGILKGDFGIGKWRNLNKQERAELDGVMEGDFRDGPVHVRLFPGRAALPKDPSDGR